MSAAAPAHQGQGDPPGHLDPDLEPFSLMAMSAGIATSVLAGQSSIQQAQTVIGYHLDRLFPAARPALHPAPMKLPATGRRAAHSTVPAQRCRRHDRRARRVEACRPSLQGQRASSRNRQLSRSTSRKPGARSTGTPVPDRHLERIHALTAGYAQKFWIGALAGLAAPEAADNGCVMGRDR